jgi:hypothetical protein
MLAFRSVVSVLVSFVVRTFSTNSRPRTVAGVTGLILPNRRASVVTILPSKPFVGSTRSQTNKDNADLRQQAPSSLS